MIKTTPTKESKALDLPLQLVYSFEKIILMYQKYVNKKNSSQPLYKTYLEIIQEVRKHPELITGFSSLSELKKHQKQIDLLLSPIFPDALTSNEIKAASIPFSFDSFKFSSRFENILKNAGDDFELIIRNFEDDLLYIYGCIMILNSVYGYSIDLKRPFMFDIPNKKSKTLKHYRAAVNIDFSEIIPTKNAPKITDDDYKLLLNNFDNIAIWKEKFPKDSYIYKGFAIVNLFDVTSDEISANISTNLLRSDSNLITDLQKNIRHFYNIPDLLLGHSIFDNVNTKICQTTIGRSTSIILNTQSEVNCSTYFCNDILKTVFIDQNVLAISDVEKYGAKHHYNNFYKTLHNQGIQSIILIPIKATENNDLALLEIASPRAYELNSVNLNKLKDILPVFEVAVKRASNESRYVREATIQEHYTSIHPSVKWRFNQAAVNYQNQLKAGIKNPKADEIIFDNIFPLYGQSDVKDSSKSRNQVIQVDLTTQLTLAINVLNEAYRTEPLPIYEEFIFRISNYLSTLKKGLKAGDEMGIIDFLKTDIYPVFNHIKQIDKKLSEQVAIYVNRLDQKLQVVYERRKEYEDSMALLNDTLSKFIDQKQEEAQAMFPHYFERYITDGIEYNMYIGSSIIPHKNFNQIYLYNLRLWQLQVMYEMENLAYQTRKEMPHKLRLASLILVHSSPISIKFRMDEKQFDVEGAYNIRYEIIKKRIDKAYLKGTEERLTVPGKIAIVYSQEKDAQEYIKYIKFLQAKNILGPFEQVDIEDLQGVSGLKALRVAVNYKDGSNHNTKLSFEDLVKEINT